MDDTVEYEQYTLMDQAKMASLLINNIKGEKRTMAQLAEESGISASTLSRIASRKVRRPLSLKFLRALAEHSADKRVDLDTLARANGMRQKQGYQSEKNMERNRRWRDVKDREASIRILISNALVDCGSRVRVSKGWKNIKDCEEKERTAFGLSPRWNCIIETDAFETNGIDYWAIIANPLIVASDDPEGSLKYGIRAMGDCCAPVFLSDLWKPELYKDCKITFVFVDEHYYKEFIDAYGKQKVNAHMSAMLVDLDGNEISEEKPFQRIGGGLCPLLQDIPAVEYSYGRDEISWSYDSEIGRTSWSYDEDIVKKS